MEQKKFTKHLGQKKSPNLSGQTKNPNYFKWFQMTMAEKMAMAMAGHCPKGSQIVPNGPQLSTMTQHSPKWSNIVSDCPKWS